VPLVAQCIAELKSSDVMHIAEITSRNFDRLFKPNPIRMS
jgi:Tat protein secretion system quality control protein TatD with DNase activity